MKSNYKKLIVWQKSVELSCDIYEITKIFPKEEIYGLVSQMRRCAISIPSNIAEGAGRGGENEFRQFLKIAKGSCSELETQLFIAMNLGFVESNKYQDQVLKIEEIIKILSTLIKKYTKN